MAHDTSGRVGPPRCRNCDSPLTQDDNHVLAICHECCAQMDAEYIQEMIQQEEGLQ